MAYVTLHERLTKDIPAALQKDLGISNPHALPRIEKVVVSTGINKSKMDSKETRAYIEEMLGLITGQKPVPTKAKKAISNFKTRTGMVVGSMVTLRGPQMEQFLDRLLSYAIPRIRDFRGLSTKFDGNGNYSIGIKDHSIFPEVPLPDANQIFGLQIQITTTTQNDVEARALLRALGVPFRPEKVQEEAGSVSEEKPQNDTSEEVRARRAVPESPHQSPSADASVDDAGQAEEEPKKADESVEDAPASEDTPEEESTSSS